MNPDGRFILFASTADNLVILTNGNPIPVLIPPRQNVYLRDRQNGTTTLVSVNLSNTGGGNGNSTPAELSPDGRYALFESTASDLVSGDTNDVGDIFLRDVIAGTTMLVSTNSNGGVADGTSRSSVMTPDGRYVAFVSEADNLVANDTNSIPDVFVRDMQNGVTTLVSVGAMSTNMSSPSESSEAPMITPDGRYVAFFSTATNLVGGVGDIGDIYVRDLVATRTLWASSYARTPVVPSVQWTNPVCYNHTLSTDGTFVAFEAAMSPTFPPRYSAGAILRYNVGTGTTDVLSIEASPTSGAYENARSIDMSPDGRFIAYIATNGYSLSQPPTNRLVVWDAQTGTTNLVSPGITNPLPTGSSYESPVITPDGRFVAFFSTATNLVTNSVAGDYHLYVQDMQVQTPVLVDVDTNGVGSIMSPGTIPRISADGRFVAFESQADGLVPNDRNRAYDVFVRDLVSNVTELVSVRHPSLSSITPNGISTFSSSSISADGRYVAFASDAEDLVPNATNGYRQVFVRDRVIGSNLLVSLDMYGVTGGNGVSAEPSISADGRYVAFSSAATNLVANYTNRTQDVFVRDLKLGVTRLVSTNTIAIALGTTRFESPVISADGRYVSFQTTVSQFFFGPWIPYLFSEDLETGVTYALSSSGLSSAALSRDGRFIAIIDIPGAAAGLAYLWDAHAAAMIYTNTVPTNAAVLAVSPDGNHIAYWASSSAPQIFVADRVANTNWPIGSGVPASQGEFRFSADGQVLTYAAADSPNGTNQVYLYDFQAGAVTLVSRNYLGFSGADGNSDSPDISPDGRFVTYRSAADDIVTSDNNTVPDVFLYDRSTLATTALSLNLFGGQTANNRSLSPIFSGDGQTIVFQSWASDILAQDYNPGDDLFAYTLLYAGIVPGAVPGSGFSVTWPVVQGVNYRVQFRDDLKIGVWQEATGTVTNSGTKAYFSDLAPISGQRFYRIVGF